MPTAEERDPAAVVKAEAIGLNFHYGKFHALKSLNMPIYEKKITALIGPSGCGKSTFLRCFNRMHDLYPNTTYGGKIVLHPEEFNIIAPEVDPIAVRMR
ncbi:MAG: ATP-binding cassette domain-containing protein, partial [Phycisphaerales bacterium]